MQPVLACAVFTKCNIPSCPPPPSVCVCVCVWHQSLHYLRPAPLIAVVCTD